MGSKMMPLIGTSDLGDTLAVLANASGPVLMAFILWSGVIKSPPLWVTWREHRQCAEDAKKWEAAALRGTALAGAAAQAVEDEVRRGPG